MKIFVTTFAAALAVAAPAWAQESAPTPVQQVIRTTDSTLTCVQISDEAAQLSDAMGGPPGSGIWSAVTDVAKAGAATFIPGAGLLIAGADALTQGDRQEKLAAALAQQNRWFYLNGLYSGRGCMENPVASTPGSTATPATAPAPMAEPTTAPGTPAPVTPPG